MPWRIFSCATAGVISNSVSGSRTWATRTMRAPSFTTRRGFRENRRRAFWTGTSRRDTAGMSAWASRLTFEPLARPVPLPFRLESEGGHSVLRTTCLALALSLLLHSLFLALLLLQVHATLVRKSPVALTLI